MVSAWPEPPNANPQASPQVRGVGCRRRLRSVVLRRHELAGSTDLPANCNRHRGSIGMSEARAFAFANGHRMPINRRMRAAIPETTQRAWLTVERDWTRMAEQEEVKGRDVLGGRRACPAAKDGWAGLGDWLGYAR